MSPRGTIWQGDHPRQPRRNVWLGRGSPPPHPQPGDPTAAGPRGVARRKQTEYLHTFSLPTHGFATTGIEPEHRAVHPGSYVQGAPAELSLRL